MHHWTDRAWWTVQDAARLLGVNRKTLYDAIKHDNFPHQHVGHYLRVPAEALGYHVRPETKTREYHVKDDVMQMELPIPAACLIPVRRFRNTRETIEPFHYEHALYAQRVVTRGA